MIPDLLEKRDFPIQDFLIELDKRELLFLQFLVSQNSEEELDMFYEQADSVDTFLKDIDKVFGNKMKKLPKEEIIEKIVVRFQNDVTKLIYKAVYQCSSNPDSISFNTIIMAVERFTIMMFAKKVRQIEDIFFSGKKEATIDKISKKMLYPQKPILNTLGVIALLGKTDFMNKKFGEEPLIYKIREIFFSLLWEQFDLIEKNKKEQMKLTIRKQKLSLDKLNKDYQKKEETFEKVKEQNKELSNQINELEKDISNQLKLRQEENENQLIQQLYLDIQKKDSQIEGYINELKKKKENPYSMYKTMIDDFQQQIANLKIQERDRTIQFKQLKRKMDELESKTIEVHIQEYIDNKGFDEKLYQYLCPFIEKYQRDLKEKEEQMVEQVIEEEERIEQKVGYCVIEDFTHYAVFADGSRIEVKDLPEHIYLGQWQFIKVQVDGTFKWAYSYKFSENERDYQIHDFGSVIYKNNEPYLMKGVWDTKKIEKIPPTIRLRDNQVVSINTKGEFLRFYHSILYNADHCMPSIKAKGQEAFYVLKIFPNGYLLRNIETGMEEFRVLESNKEDITEQQILFVDDNRIVHVQFSSKFYTFSNFYKKSEHGTVEIQNNVVFIRKLSGEVVIVNEIPNNITLKEGEVIIVDEFNNYMTIKKEPFVTSETEERKRLSSSSRSVPSKKNSVKNIEVEKEVLIVGKITYENSYKMTLYKKGYRAEIVDGYSPWAKIYSSLKGKDYVVVITDFVSHDNMWRIKDESLDIPVIFPEYDGANRIIEKIEELELNEKMYK